MSNKVRIQKTIYGLNSFNSVIDTDFYELTRASKTEPPVSLDTSIDEFFNQYDLLFFDIPLDGSLNTHLGLATRSLDYLGISLEDLQNEIKELREENVNLKNQILLASEINPGTQV